MQGLKTGTAALWTTITAPGSCPGLHLKAESVKPPPAIVWT
jgi:hypothetical protein